MNDYLVKFNDGFEENVTIRADGFNWCASEAGFGVVFYEQDNNGRGHFGGQQNTSMFLGVKSVQRVEVQ